MEMLYRPMVGVDLRIWGAIFRDSDLDHKNDLELFAFGNSRTIALQDISLVLEQLSARMLL
jgi:hypothetical protein